MTEGSPNEFVYGELYKLTFNTSISDEKKINYFSQDNCSQTEETEIVELRNVTANLASLVKDNESLKRDLNLAKSNLISRYQTELQQKSVELYARLNQQIASVERDQADRIGVVRSAFKTQLVDALAVLQQQQKTRSNLGGAGNAGQSTNQQAKIIQLNRKIKELEKDLRKANVKINELEMSKNQEQSLFLNMLEEDGEEDTGFIVESDDENEQNDGEKDKIEETLRSSDDEENHNEAMGEDEEDEEEEMPNTKLEAPKQSLEKTEKTKKRIKKKKTKKQKAHADEDSDDELDDSRSAHSYKAFELQINNNDVNRANSPSENQYEAEINSRDDKIKSLELQLKLVQSKAATAANAAANSENELLEELKKKSERDLQTKDTQLNELETKNTELLDKIKELECQIIELQNAKGKEDVEKIVLQRVNSAKAKWQSENQIELAKLKNSEKDRLGAVEKEKNQLEKDLTNALIQIKKQATELSQSSFLRQKEQRSLNEIQRLKNLMDKKDKNWERKIKQAQQLMESLRNEMFVRKEHESQSIELHNAAVAYSHDVPIGILPDIPSSLNTNFGVPPKSAIDATSIQSKNSPLKSSQSKKIVKVNNVDSKFNSSKLSGELQQDKSNLISEYFDEHDDHEIIGLPLSEEMADQLADRMRGGDFNLKTETSEITLNNEEFDADQHRLNNSKLETEDSTTLMLNVSIVVPTE